MRNLSKISLVIALTLILSTFILSTNTFNKVANVHAVPGEYIVGVKEVNGEATALINGSNFEIIRRIDQINALLVRVKDGVNAQKSIETLSNHPLVRYVEPNYIVQIPPTRVIKVIEITQLNETQQVKLKFTPNDSFWSTDPVYGIGQWDMRVIDADEAWNIQMGSHDVIVAVIDSGVRRTHHDLDANYMPGGYDWVNDDNDPNDDNGHGTHVAGVIAAETNNGYGIAGLAQVSLVAEKVLNSVGVGNVADLASAIIHAADLGADIINLSLGTYEYSTALEDAVTYAYNKGCVLIAAAGNENIESPLYPAALDKVIAVASTYGEPNDSRAPYSNYGDWITLSAPGGYGSYSVLSTYHQGDDYFAYIQGTSQATPHVSGLAALYKSQYPTATNIEIEYMLKRGVEDKGEEGWDELYGYGRINVYNTLTAPKAVGGEGEIIILENQENIWFDFALTAALVFVSSVIVKRRTT